MSTVYYNNTLVNVQVLLHEGGTLLVCLNSIRALEEPSWSWRADILQAFVKFKSLLTSVTNNTPKIQASPS